MVLESGLQRVTIYPLTYGTHVQLTINYGRFAELKKNFCTKLQAFEWLVSFEREREWVARIVCNLYDPYERMDEGMTEAELYDETLHLLETEPETIAEWLEGVR